MSKKSTNEGNTGKVTNMGKGVKKDKAWLRYLKYITAGIVTGTANGLFGSGGGTIAVPAMVHMMDMEENRAHATAISIILPLTLVSAFFYVKGNYVDWWIALKVSIGGIAGGYLGAKLLPVVPDRILRKV